MDDTVSAPTRTAEETMKTSVPSNKIVEEFRYLLDKSQQLFMGLRELPPTGRNWQPHFQRTFEVYTRIWKFQQQHRTTLESKEFYDLKRWEIGELASKIGQLYYQYYSRTSETNYLVESFVFYEAIRDRGYFKDVMEAKNAGLVVKKLRYIARFVVVALLLNRSDVVNSLHESLNQLVEEYNSEFHPADYADWKVVVSEIGTFIEADRKLAPIDGEGKVLTTMTRVKGGVTPNPAAGGLKLQEAILVANYQNQIKFAELTLDMYRIMQSLERDPPLTGNPGGVIPPKENHEEEHTTSGVGMAAIDTENTGTSVKRSNPRKYLLYRPSFAQISLYLATCFKDISENAALLLYISADGSKVNSPDSSDFYTGGVATSVHARRSEKVDADTNALVHALHPEDLIPFTRKPFFLVVDSNNSSAFNSARIGKVFGQPFMALLSPTEYPATIKDTTHIGSLFTLFLHCPIKALAFVADVNTIAAGTWTSVVALMNSLEIAVSDALDQDSTLDKSIRRFIQDDFLRQLVVRFVIARIILKAHTAFKDEKNLPTCWPELPPNITDNSEILAKLVEIVGVLNVKSVLASIAKPTTTSE